MPPKNYRQATEQIYAGGEPSFNDLKELKEKGITSILSLDQQVATRIQPYVKNLQFKNHFIYNIDPSSTVINSELKRLTRELKSKLSSNQPIYVHCLQGKDRTGLALAMYSLFKNPSLTAEQALADPKSWGYGTGVSAQTQKAWNNLLNSIRTNTPVDSIKEEKKEESSEEKSLISQPMASSPSATSPSAPTSTAPMTGASVDDISYAADTSYLQEDITSLIRDVYRVGDNPPAFNMLPSFAPHESYPFSSVREQTYIPEIEIIDVVPQVGEIDKNHILPGRASMIEVWAHSIIPNNNMITKLAATLEMSFKVPDSEKEIAQVAVENFLSVINSFTIIKDHLDLIYNPFKNAESLSSEEVFQYRGKLNRFKNQVKKNFKILKNHAFKALQKINYFSKDTHCIELIGAFKESMNDVISAGIKLIKVLDDYRVSDFKDKIVAAIDNIKKEASQTEELVRDRIIDHIKSNIIGESWINEDNDATELAEKIPTVIEIYKNINKGINQSEVPQIQKRPQSLNFSDSQRVFYPQDMRESTKVAL